MEVDVLIAGGGPAGLEAASAIASRGWSAMVLEQDSEVGSPTRTSGGTFVRDMVQFGIPERLYHKVTECRFFSPSNSASFSYDQEPIVCVIDVRGTFQFLAERAALAGASIRPATTALETLKDPEGVVKGVRARMGNRTFEIHSKIVIDATGYKASMVKSSKVTDGSHRFGVGAEYDLFAPNYNRAEVVLIVGSQIAPNGYAWFCPWGDKRVRAGVGVIHPDSKLNPETFLDKLITQAADWGVNLAGAQPIEYHYGLIPSEGMIEPFVGDGILAAGDSAGQPSQLLGEGIRWALFAGRMAGEVCSEALACGDYSAKFLKRYQDRWMKKYGRNLKIAYEINKRIANYQDFQWDAKVELMKHLTPPQFARALGSDFSPAFWAGLALTKPGLMREGIRKLISLV
jgi:digeranylgeranylglycerophospholipid reductase